MTDTIDDVRHDLTSARKQASNLRIALASSRTIAVAIGITMERLQVSEQQAFDVLRRASQHGHRKIRDIAEDIVFCGVLPTTGPSS